MDQTCPVCSRLAKVAEHFDCGGCARPQVRYEPCEHLAAADALSGHCEMCAPGGANDLAQVSDLAESIRRMVTGLAEGREAMTARTGRAYEHHRIITQAWIAAGRPRKGDPGWLTWLGQKYQLRRRLGLPR